MWLKYDILIQIRQAFNSKKNKRQKENTITSLLTSIIGSYYFWVTVKWMLRKWGKAAADKNLWIQPSCERVFFLSLRWRRRRRGRRRETAAKWACFLLLCVFLIPPNKLNSAALKRSEEGNDWPQKTLLSPNLTINRSWQTVYQHSTKCYFVL